MFPSSRRIKVQVRDTAPTVLVTVGAVSSEAPWKDANNSRPAVLDRCHIAVSRRVRGRWTQMKEYDCPGWQDAWTELLRHMDDVLPERVKRQASAEVIMLTHNADLHEVNLRWHPRGEDVLWRPDVQETKRSQNGALNLRYRAGVKRRALEELRGLLARHAPWLSVRYAF